MQFLSTLSLRRATSAAASWFASRKYFYPRSPCGERLGFSGAFGVSDKISIHALLAESDGNKNIGHHCTPISIHALLAESDRSMSIPTARPPSSFLSTLSLRRATIFDNIFRYFLNNFYPRSPCGERPIRTLILHMARLFLSTLSLRRATT